MTTKDFLRGMSEIDDNYFEEAAMYSRPKKKVLRIWYLAPVAACLIVAVSFTFLWSSPTIFSPGHPINSPSSSISFLPRLDVDDDARTFDLGSFEVFDINDVFNENPWSEDADIDTLPVFYNSVRRDRTGGPSREILTERVKEAASKMNLTIDEISSVPNVGSGESPEYVIAVCGKTRISADADGIIEVYFDDGGIEVDEEYRSSPCNITNQQAEKTLRHLLEKYRTIIGMKNPVSNLCGLLYANERETGLAAYENSDSITGRILNYNFNTVYFSLDAGGKLHVINRYNADLSQKIGDYPIITAERARELLLNKHYITALKEELPGAEYIAKVELIYRASSYDEVFMPYYRFIAELPSTQEGNGKKRFGAFYVPAVEENFLVEMPTWTGTND